MPQLHRHTGETKLTRVKLTVVIGGNLGLRVVVRLVAPHLVTDAHGRHKAKIDSLVGTVVRDTRNGQRRRASCAISLARGFWSGERAKRDEA